MFSKETYQKRRDVLKKRIKSGVILLPGNNLSPMNYEDNTYHFRQDSSFLYYFGIDEPGVFGVIDIDNDEEIIFGDDVAIEDIIWTGPLPKLKDKAKKVNVSNIKPTSKLQETIHNFIKSGKQVLYLPQYRGDIIITLQELTGIHTSLINNFSSDKLSQAVIDQRSVKSTEEVEEIEKALDISYEMNATAMRLIKPNTYEYEVCGNVQGIVLSHNSHISFPVIFTIHGETLHNHGYNNLMKDGDIAILDSGAESPLHYASDITRSIPVNGKFSPEQKDIYTIVLQANLDAIDMMKPGVFNKDCHLKACKTIAENMKQLGFMKGNPDDAVEAGAHALFMPHGLGHMMGLDVHDLEGLGEDRVGYNETVQRSEQFGLNALRLAKKLQPGYVLTVEPGIYFIPELIDRWKDEKKFKEFINYDKVNSFRNFGGIRIEDDVLITKKGHKVLGKPIAKTPEEVEEWCAK